MGIEIVVASKTDIKRVIKLNKGVTEDDADKYAYGMYWAFVITDQELEVCVVRWNEQEQYKCLHKYSNCKEFGSIIADKYLYNRKYKH